jgi:hypothetical protein
MSQEYIDSHSPPEVVRDFIAGMTDKFFMRQTCCDHGYGRPSWRPRVSAPATYRSGTPRNQHPAVARWHTHLRGLATAIHEISGPDLSSSNIETGDPPAGWGVRRTISNKEFRTAEVFKSN